MRTCDYKGCGKPMDHMSVLAKTCADCAQALRQERRNAGNQRRRDAHRASMLSRSAPPRICQYPGCTTDISNRGAKAVWCMACRRAMDQSRAKRRYGKEGRAAVDPFERRVHVAGGGDHHPIKCLQCCDMPWARRADRHNSRNGDSSGPGIAVAVNGVCRGCGLPWEPEPKPELVVTIRSSAAMAADHGALHGGSYDWRSMPKKGAK